MRRIYTRPKGAPINDPRIGQPMWSKPGTVGDRIYKAFGSALARIQPADFTIRQQRRAAVRGYIGTAG